MDHIPFHIIEWPAFVDHTVATPDCRIPEPAIIDLFDNRVWHTTSIPAPVKYTVGLQDYDVGGSGVIASVG
jgi:hypothetical protein